MIAALLLAALVPTGTPAAPEPTPAFVSLFDLPPEPVPPPDLSQHAVTKTLQVVGGSGIGAVASCGGTVAALLPALFLASADSGDVGASTLLLGAGIGYSVGVGWAVHSAGDEIGGCKGNRLMTTLGAGAALALTAGALRSELIETSVESVLLGSLVPPVAGILVFELTREGPCARKPVPEGVLVVGAVLTLAGGMYYLAETASLPAPDARRVLVPLVGLRW